MKKIYINFYTNIKNKSKKKEDIVKVNLKGWRDSVREKDLIRIIKENIKRNKESYSIK